MNKAATFTTTPAEYATARMWSDAEKVARGCESADCPIPVDYMFVPAQLQWAHIERGTAHKNSKGERVHPTAMLKAGSSKWGARYSQAAILAELSECRVLCGNCHALETSQGR